MISSAKTRDLGVSNGSRSPPFSGNSINKTSDS